MLRAVARLAGRFPVGTRLALRDLARFESRSAAALGAITLALGIAVSVVVDRRRQRARRGRRQLAVRPGGRLDLLAERVRRAAGARAQRCGRGPKREADVAAIAALAPGARLVPLDVAVDPANPEVAGGQRLLNNAVLGRPIDENTVRDSGRVFIATPELARLLEDRRPTSSQPGTFVLTHQSGEVYITGNITNPVFIRDPVPAGKRRAPRRPQPLVGPAHADDRSRPRSRRARAHAGRLAPRPRQPLTADDLARARELAAGAGLAIEVRDTNGGLTTIRHIATAAGVLLALSILAMTAGLLRGESRHELRTLHAVGATGTSVGRSPRRHAPCSLSPAPRSQSSSPTPPCSPATGPTPTDSPPCRSPTSSTLAVGLPLLAASLAWMLGGRDGADIRSE